MHTRICIEDIDLNEVMRHICPTVFLLSLSLWRCADSIYLAYVLPIVFEREQKRGRRVRICLRAFCEWTCVLRHCRLESTVIVRRARERELSPLSHERERERNERTQYRDSLGMKKNKVLAQLSTLTVTVRMPRALTGL